MSDPEDASDIPYVETESIENAARLSEDLSTFDSPHGVIVRNELDDDVQDVLVEFEEIDALIADLKRRKAERRLASEYVRSE